MSFVILGSSGVFVIIMFVEIHYKDLSFSAQSYAVLLHNQHLLCNALGLSLAVGETKAQ
jgi:hypothetical protein